MLIFSLPFSGDGSANDGIGIEGIFWLYGSISFVGLIFITIFVPETKGKNEAQLSEYFAKSKSGWWSGCWISKSLNQYHLPYFLHILM